MLRWSYKAVNHQFSRTTFGLALLAAVCCSGLRGQAASPQHSKHVETALRRGVVEPPGDAKHLCDGHVSGAMTPDRKPGPHITWDAYYSQEIPTVLAKRYLDSLGQEAHSAEAGCDTWRFPPDKPSRILEVCPVSAAGPWTECSKAPRQAASIILISSLARAD